MNEERRLILEMLKEGSISVEEAERLLEALPVNNKDAESANGAITTNLAGVMPKRIIVRVTDDDKTKVNVRIPFSLVRAGLKLGQTIGSLVAKHSPEYSKEFAILKDIDIDELLSRISEGEISLPYTFVDVEEEDDGKHVLVILE